MAVIVGVTGNNPLLQGTPDADEIFGNSTGTVTFTAGNDRIFGRGGDDLITGDGVTIAPNGKGGNDVIQGGDGDDEIYGDASGSLFGIGGNDTLYQNVGFGRVVGDAANLEAGSRGGNDRIFGGSTLVGDSNFEMFGARGGNDLLDATGASDRVTLLGESDASLSEGSSGGDDVLKGSAFGDILYGDAGAQLRGGSSGGDDRLFGNGGDDRLAGDSSGTMDDTSTGGDDILRGGAGNDDLFGDSGTQLRGFAQGGDDRLYSGGGDDEIWGDGRLFEDAVGGKDSFHFNGNFGDDSIYDFRQEDGDRVVFKGLIQNEVQIAQVGSDTVLTTLGDESVTLVGFTGGLTVGTDIIFA